MPPDESSSVAVPLEGTRDWIGRICSASGTNGKRDKRKKRVEADGGGGCSCVNSVAESERRVALLGHGWLHPRLSELRLSKHTNRPPSLFLLRGAWVYPSVEEAGMTREKRPGGGRRMAKREESRRRRREKDGSREEKGNERGLQQGYEDGRGPRRETRKEDPGGREKRRTRS